MPDTTASSFRAALVAFAPVAWKGRAVYAAARWAAQPQPVAVETGGRDTLPGVEPGPTDEAHIYIVAGAAEVFDTAQEKLRVTLGLGTRGVAWGYLQDGSEDDLADVEVITSEDGKAAAVVYRNQRTEVVFSAVFFNDQPLPVRGSRVAWLNAGGQIVLARVVRRRVEYQLGTIAMMQIAATKWDGLP